MAGNYVRWGLNFRSLRLFLLSLLLLVLGSRLTLLNRVGDVFRSLVGLALVVHGILSGTLVGHADHLFIIGVLVFSDWALLLLVELEIYRAGLTFLVGDVGDLNLLADHIVGNLLFREMSVFPLGGKPRLG